VITDKREFSKAKNHYNEPLRDGGRKKEAEHLETIVTNIGERPKETWKIPQSGWAFELFIKPKKRSIKKLRLCV
jgi:hypothetical protein